MSTRILVVALVGLMTMAAAARAQVGPDAFVTTDNELLVTVSNNEAALDSQAAARVIEIHGIAKKILRTDSGDYVLQFAPDNRSDNFVRLHINCEFGRDQRDALGSIRLPAGITIRGAVKESQWKPRYDNHRYYEMVIRDSQITATYALLR